MLTLDLLATFAFALVGARVAADKGLDYGGIAFIAAVASLSGGTLRNVFLGIRPIWIIDPWIVLSVIAAVLLTLVFRRVTRIGKTLLLMDTFGLAVAAMSGTQLAYEMDVVWFGKPTLFIDNELRKYAAKAGASARDGVAYCRFPDSKLCCDFLCWIS